VSVRPKALYSEAQGELQRDAEGPEHGDVDGLGHPEGGPEGRRRRRRDGRELGECGVEGADDGEERAVEEGHERAEGRARAVCVDADQARHDACVDAVLPTLARVMPSDEWLAALGRPGGGGGPDGSPQKTAAGALRGLL
jgi:hypothetical protein